MSSANQPAAYERPLGPLPQKVHLERSLLGAVIVDVTALAVAEQHLSGAEFSLSAHRMIFSEMQRLARSGRSIQLVSLWDALQHDGGLLDLGGLAYLSSLPDGLYKNAPVAEWAKKIREAALLRGVAYACEDLIQSALEPGTAPDHLAAKIESLSRRFASELKTHSRHLVALPVAELLARTIKPRDMLLDPILPEQGLMMLYSYRGIGKTFFSFGIAAAVASGTRFLNWVAPRPRNVLYIDGELPAKTVQERLAMVLAGIDGPEPASGALRIITPDLQDFPMPDLATSQGQRLVEQHLDGIDLVVLDNLSCLCRSGDESEGEDWLPIQEWSLSLRRRGMSVLFDHHAGKNKAQRGTSKREDLLDTVITLKHPSDYNPSDGLRCEVHFEKTRAMLGLAAKPFEVRMESGLDGRAVWTWKEMDDMKAAKAGELFSAGLSVRDVAEELQISKSQAGRYRQQWAGGALSGVSLRPTI